MMRKDRALDAFLISQIQAGNALAGEKLVRVRGPRLMAHARRLLGEAEAARDIVQQAWIDIFKGVKGLRDPRAFLPWALCIVSRKVASEISRRQKSRAFLHEFAEEMVPSTQPIGDARADAAIVRAAIDDLPAPMRATIALFYLEEMTVAEVALALDVPEGTVKTRLMRARERLRRALDGDKT